MMMKKFPNNLITNLSFQTKRFAYPIPILCVQPAKQFSQSVIFIFNCGLGGTNKWHEFMCLPVFQSNYFICYEKAGHGNNKNKPSQYRRQSIEELQEVILFIRSKYPNKKIYLLGESWGASINFLYLKKYGHQYVNGAVNWNMPYKPIDIEKQSFTQKFSLACKLLFTYIFNIALLEKQTNFIHDKLSQNAVLVRVKKLVASAPMNTKLPLCAWRFMKPSWRFLFKNLHNDSYNFLYIQSAQDILADQKNIDKINLVSKNNKKYLFIQTGYHVLAFEPVESKILNDAIAKFISK